MNKVYNDYNFLTSSFHNFFKNFTNVLHKPQLNFLPALCIGILNTSSINSFSIANYLIKYFPDIKKDSLQKRISRILSNPRFDGHSLFDSIVQLVINNYKLKHKDKRVHIVIDHMYSKENYTILMLSMRIGKQGIPIYFKTYKGDHVSQAYLDSTLKDAINHVHNIFINTDFKLIFLADRWFNSKALLSTISSLGHTYVIRFKGNQRIKVYDKKEKRYIYHYVENLFSYKYHSNFFENVIMYPDSSSSFKANITVGMSAGFTESWIIVTNGDPKRAIKDYAYRFGAIETIFKNQKSNGFYLEKTVNASQTTFENIYSLICIATLLFTCLGTEYSKNTKCYRNFSITTHKNINNVKTRIKSLFRVGLELFKSAFESKRYIRLPIRFILYDI